MQGKLSFILAALLACGVFTQSINGQSYSSLNYLLHDDALGETRGGTSTGTANPIPFERVQGHARAHASVRLGRMSVTTAGEKWELPDSQPGGNYGARLNPQWWDTFTIYNGNTREVSLLFRGLIRRHGIGYVDHYVYINGPLNDIATPSWSINYSTDVREHEPETISLEQLIKSNYTSGIPFTVRSRAEVATWMPVLEAETHFEMELAAVYIPAGASFTQVSDATYKVISALSILPQTNGTLQLTWFTIGGRPRIEMSETAQAGTWSGIATHITTEGNGNYSASIPEQFSTRFFRLLVE